MRKLVKDRAREFIVVPAQHAGEDGIVEQPGSSRRDAADEHIVALFAQPRTFPIRHSFVEIAAIRHAAGNRKTMQHGSIE